MVVLFSIWAVNEGDKIMEDEVTCWLTMLEVEEETVSEGKTFGENVSRTKQRKLKLE